MAEWLLNNHATPIILARLREPRTIELMTDIGEVSWRNGQVVGPVASGAAGAIELLKLHGQAIEGLVIGEGTGNKVNALSQALPDTLTEVGAGALFHCGAHIILKVLLRPFATTVAD